MDCALAEFSGSPENLRTWLVVVVLGLGFTPLAEPTQLHSTDFEGRLAVREGRNHVGDANASGGDHALAVHCPRMFTDRRAAEPVLAKARLVYHPQAYCSLWRSITGNSGILAMSSPSSRHAPYPKRRSFCISLPSRPSTGFSSRRFEFGPTPSRYRFKQSSKHGWPWHHGGRGRISLSLQWRRPRQRLPLSILPPCCSGGMEVRGGDSGRSLGSKPSARGAAGTRHAMECGRSRMPGQCAHVLTHRPTPEGAQPSRSLGRSPIGAPRVVATT